MANEQKKFRVPRINTPWDLQVDQKDEPTFQYINDVLRELQRDKQEGGDFNLSGVVAGDLLYAGTDLVFVPGKGLPSSYAVSGGWLIGGALSVSGLTTLGGTLNVSGITALASSGSVGSHWSVGGNLVVTGTAGVSGAVSLGSTLGVSGLTTIGGALNVSGLTSLVGKGKVYNGTSPPGSEVLVVSDSTETLNLAAFRVGVNHRAVLTVSYNGTEPNQFAVLQFATASQMTGLGNFSCTAINLQSSPFEGYASFKSPNTSEPIVALYNSSDIRVGRVAANGVTDIIPRDAGTSALLTVLSLGHNSTATPGTGFGSEVRFQLKSSTTEDRNAGGVSYEWEVATEGSQIGLGRLTAYYITTSREVMQWGATSSKPKVGFLGAASAIQQTGGAATAGAAYGATEQTMLQAAYDALRTFGFLS